MHCRTADGALPARASIGWGARSVIAWCTQALHRPPSKAIGRARGADLTPKRRGDLVLRFTSRRGSDLLPVGEVLVSSTVEGSRRGASGECRFHAASKAWLPPRAAQPCASARRLEGNDEARHLHSVPAGMRAAIAVLGVVMGVAAAPCQRVAPRVSTRCRPLRRSSRPSRYGRGCSPPCHLDPRRRSGECPMLRR